MKPADRTCLIDEAEAMLGGANGDDYDSYIGDLLEWPLLVDVMHKVSTLLPWQAAGTFRDIALDRCRALPSLKRQGDPPEAPVHVIFDDARDIILSTFKECL